MKHTFNKMLASGSILAGSLLIATMLSAQAPAGAPAGAPGAAPAGNAPAAGGAAPAAGGNRPAGGMGGGGMSINIEFYAPEDDEIAMKNVQP